MSDLEADIIARLHDKNQRLRALLRELRPVFHNCQCRYLGDGDTAVCGDCDLRARIDGALTADQPESALAAFVRSAPSEREASATEPVRRAFDSMNADKPDDQLKEPMK